MRKYRLSILVMFHDRVPYAKAHEYEARNFADAMESIDNMPDPWTDIDSSEFKENNVKKMSFEVEEVRSA